MDRDTALQTLTEGLAHLSTSAEWQAYLDVQRRFHKYSFYNSLMIQAQTKGEATQVAGFKKWIELGRMVRKGEKGIAILVPYFGKPKDVKGDEEEGPRVIHSFGVGHVFDIKQTDGEPIAEAPKPILLGGEDPTGSRMTLERIAGTLGFTVEERPREDISKANGMCDFAAKRLFLADDLEPAAMIKTLIHEMAHATLHGDGYISRSTAELEAESVAYCVSAELGLDSSSYSFNYILHWTGKEGLETLKHCGQRIQKATAAILDAVAALPVLGAPV